MPTPHIGAKPGDLADTVLLPGDPARARHIAQTLLERATLVTDVRNMLGFTGNFRGHRVSVMGTGMGIPSCSIYATELVREYGVRRLVRVGTCGGIQPVLQLGDLVLAQGASTDSRVNRLRLRGHDFAALASFDLLRRVAVAAESRQLRVRVGNVFSTDSFYHPDPTLIDLLQRYGVLAVEMEAAGLYGVAAEFGVEALAVLTVSDRVIHSVTDTAESAGMSAGQREHGVDTMSRLVLESLY